MPSPRPLLLFVVNTDWFFVSHRLRLAQACRAAGYDVQVCASESEARRTIERAGFPFHSLPIDRGGTNPVRDQATIRALARLYRSLRPAVVHHVTIKPVLYGGTLARLYDIPAVHAVSGLGYVFIRAEEEGGLPRVLSQALDPAYRFVFGHRRCRVIFQNPADRAQFLHRGLVAPERTALLHGSGVDTDRFAASPLPGGDRPIVLLPARVLWDKGLGEFVEAARLVRARLPGARFVVAGRIDPGNPAAVPEYAMRAWVDEGTIEWLGSLTPDEMPAVYREATLVALPSYREGLPLAVAEAQACGRAVVTTDVSGCRDAIRDGQTGWLVPVRDAAALAGAILGALTDRAELGRRSAAAVDFARERFSERTIYDGTLALYAALGVLPG